jgi:hypothetical protein
VHNEPSLNLILKQPNKNLTNKERFPTQLIRTKTFLSTSRQIKLNKILQKSYSNSVIKTILRHQIKQNKGRLHGPAFNWKGKNH